MWHETYNLHQQEYDSYSHLRSQFEWDIPDSFNAAYWLCDRWAGDTPRTALYYVDRTQDRSGTFTFSDLSDASNQFANYLRSEGVSSGDRIVVNMPQKPETLLAHLGIWKIGAVSVPMSILYGEDAIDYRLADSAPKLAIVDSSNIETFQSANSLDIPIISVGETDGVDSVGSFQSVISQFETTVEPADTHVTDPLLLMYSSGTTGPPKGILQPHRSVIGHLPGAVTNFYNCDITDRDVLWTPSEWAWGASFSVMFSALFFGRPVVAHETGKKFDAEEAFDLIEEFEITNPFVPPSALRMMMLVSNTQQWDLSHVRVVSSGGESLGKETRTWAQDTFDAPIHEVYGLTETFNLIIGDCRAYLESKPGKMGYALPGHEVTILDPDTHESLAGDVQVGEIGIKRDDPTMFLEYWNRPKATESTFAGEWMLTGDLAEKDEDGCFDFLGRKDDLIISAGYRIGPEEIEDCLVTNDAVAEAGVIGVPDEKRGQVPKAFIVLTESAEASQDLRETIQTYVKSQLAAYEYPREIEFVDSIPRTTTGKVRRAQLRDLEGIE